MDFIINFPLNAKLSIKILLIIINQLSKGVILIPILLISVPVMTMVFIEHYIPYITRLGPDYIIPGPWPEFTPLALWFKQEPLYNKIMTKKVA